MSELLPAFCSLRSKDAAEQVFGTASTGDAWLLLENERPWGAKAFSDSELPEAVKTHLSGVLKSVPRSRVLLIKRTRRSKGPLTLFVARSRES